MHIGLLQTGHLPEDFQAKLGNYPELYGRLLNPEGVTMTAYPVVDGIFPEGPRAHEGWLISGSRHGAYEDHDWIPRLEELIREIVAARVPLVGICFGHQIMAQALGGTVEKFDGGWAVGRHSYDWDGDEVVLNAWHQDQVTEAPEEAEVLSSSPFCANAALRYGRHGFSMQAHPEFGPDETRMLLETRAPGVVPAPLIEAALGALERPVHNDALAARIAAFLKEGASHDRVA